MSNEISPLSYGRNKGEKKMGRYNDKIVTIRFNPRELEMLEKVVDARSMCYDTLSSVVKKILKEEYDRLAFEKRIL